METVVAVVVTYWWAPALVVLGVLAERRRALRRLVFANLDSAAANGYFGPGEHLDGMAPDDIAYDMTLHASDLEDVPPAKVAPYVLTWMISRGVL